MAAPLLFDLPLLRRRRDRAARSGGAPSFLLDAAADDLTGRLADIRRDFPAAADIGAHGGTIAARLAGRTGVRTLAAGDWSPAMAAAAEEAAPPGLAVLAAAGAADALPLAANAFDLVVSCLSLQWCDDLPAALAEALRILVPDGLFLAVLPGAETLCELRDSLARAELECEGGVSPRVAPMLTLADGSALLQRAGFAMPVADVDRLTADYADPMDLLGDLRAMGEANALCERLRRPTRRTTFAAMRRIYRERYGRPDGRIPATFDLITLTGWKPLENEVPLAPGPGHPDPPL